MFSAVFVAFSSQPQSAATAILKEFLFVVVKAF
jgi:hypothetical protein